MTERAIHIDEARIARQAALQTYLLGRIDFEDALSLQRRLVYEVGGGAPPSLLLCEHSPILTVGRHGSRGHFLFEENDPSGRRLRIRWVNRGGGCWLQLPGQLALYSFLPLQQMGIPLREYSAGIRRAIIATLGDFDIHGEIRLGSTDVWAGDRPIACLGVAVRQWVTYFGAVLNINPDLTLYRLIRTGKNHPPMTSMERERQRPVRAALVRQRLIEHVTAQFGFDRNALFTDHPLLCRKAPVDAILAAC